MNDPLQFRADALLERYVASLSPSLYSFVKPEPQEGLYFKIAKKGHNGQHWGTLRAMTLYEYRMLVSTSATDQEAWSRLDAYVMEGKGTFREPEPAHAAPSVPLDQVQAIVRAAVEQALAAQRTSATAIPLHTASPEASVAPSHSMGVTAPITQNPPYPPRTQKVIDLWTERATILGIDPPKMSKGLTRLDGRWLRKAEEKWRLRQEAQRLTEIEPVAT